MYFSSTLGIYRSSVKLQLIVFVIIVEQRAVGGSREAAREAILDLIFDLAAAHSRPASQCWCEHKYIHTLETNTFTVLTQIHLDS